MRRVSRWILIILGVGLLAACSLSNNDSEPQVVYITATPGLESQPPVMTSPPQQNLSPVPENIGVQPTLDPPRSSIDPQNAPQEHIVQANDTLYGIALAYGVSLDSLLAANELTDPNTLFIGQAIELPGLPTQQTPDFKIIPDSRLVRAPGSAAFDIAGFVNAQPGYIRTVTDEVVTRMANGGELKETLNAAQIVDRVSLEYSVDPRLLLVLLEYRAGWLSNTQPREDLQTHPLIAQSDSAGVDRSGLYKQLAWAANQLNWGYYSWKYRGWTTLEFPEEGQRLLYAAGLNAGTVALQYFLGLNSFFAAWQLQTSPNGIYQFYFAYFGDPFANALEPLVPPNIQQPAMTLPFASGEVWFYTGGWHGGWGSGSAWSAVDFAPPDEPQDILCYTSNFAVRAVAGGVIARSGGGAVILDLDGDGDESTGWTVLYLHLASRDRVAVNTRVQPGDFIGWASCEGGFSTATHLHIGRRYNGEWIPAQCIDCAPQDMRPAFNMSGWSVVGIPNQEYQGYLNLNGERRVAEQGRLTPENRISW